MIRRPPISTLTDTRFPYTTLFRSALIGTLLQGIVCAVFSIPLGIFVAIYLVEYADRKSKLGKLTTFMVDILSGVPSIVAALFIYALWIATFGFPKSAFAVSLALVLLMVPVVIRDRKSTRLNSSN